MKHFLSRLKWRVIWSWRGTIATWQTEHSFRTWVWANAISAGLALWLPIGWGERAVILSLGLLVLAFELINTAVEEAVDYISKDDHPMAAKAKDAGSAAVAMAAVATGVAWVVAILGMWIG